MHEVGQYGTIEDTSFGDDPAWTIVGRAGSLLALFVGGMAFGVLRLVTGGLAAPMAFHWMVVVAMRGTLFALED